MYSPVDSEDVDFYRPPLKLIMIPSNAPCSVETAISWDNDADIMAISFQGSYIYGLVQERCHSSALAMELRLSCTNPLIYVYVPSQ